MIGRHSIHNAPSALALTLQLCLIIASLAQSQTNMPHGEAFAMDCAKCHTASGWQVDTKTITFNHDSTEFPLLGQHATLSDCIACHQSLVFSEAQTNCAACHTDLHQGTVGFDCARCHDSNSWALDDTETLHEIAGFPRTGKHLEAACTQCHQSASQLRFDVRGIQCVDCHINDFNQTKEPNHLANHFGEDCSTCHSLELNSWKDIRHPISVQHDFFPLTEGHDIQDCAACHSNSNYSSLSPDCQTCHLNEYQNAKKIDHKKLAIPMDCAFCHTTTPGWQPATFPIHDKYYPLTGGHAAIQGECQLCHKNADYADVPNTCVGCHNQDYLSTTTPNHSALDVPKDCAMCHTTDPGWQPATFPIHDRFYPLTGGHADVQGECQKCHDITNYSNISSDCQSCHTADHAATTNPNHTALNLALECQNCHTTQRGWKPAKFDVHDQFYPLTGGHDRVREDCISCHNGEYNNTPTACQECHQEAFKQSKDPDHTALNIPVDCAMCHTTEPGWQPAKFPIHDDYYPLKGGHALVAEDCATCHNGTYTNTPTECRDCHTTHYEQARNPNHTALNIPMDCAMCHTEEPGWKPATFPIHDKYYPLTGGHAAIQGECQLCHKNADYADVPNTCVGCHNQDYLSTTTPNHSALDVPKDCAMCHTTDPGWQPATFPIHDRFYPLTGGHALIQGECQKCHINWVYENTPTACESCHAQDYRENSNPNHTKLDFPMDCAECHTTQPDWKPAKYLNHDDLNFPIYSGKHRGTWDACMDCHTNPNNYMVFTCISCHTNPETDEEHEMVLGYAYVDQACLMCHPNGDKEDDPDHSITGFPLEGVHHIDDCLQCHSNGFGMTSSECQDCHTPDYRNTKNPDHASLGLSLECQHCHNTDNAGWKPAQFPDHTKYWEFTGAHIEKKEDCIACHKGNYVNTPTACEGCHKEDYDQSKNPNHPNLNIPMECVQCHTTEPGWAPATFDIHDNYWEFTGAHIDIKDNCIDCHHGNYNNTPTACEGCHQKDYDKTSNPDHPTLGIPMECAQCHTTDAGWKPATFDIHDNYWEFTGAHIDVKDKCEDCHHGDYNNTPTACEGCHQDNYDATTNPNHGALSPPIPTDCAMCHTTEPGWKPAQFPIHDDYWALTGAHADIADECAQCHNGNYNNTPSDCVGCHQSNYDATTNPNHGGISPPISTDCALCHTTEPGWVPADFPVHDDYYMLTGAHQDIKDDCYACHQGDYNNTPNDCDGCHHDNYLSTSNPDHQKSSLNIGTDCQTCHTTDPGWAPALFPQHDNFFVLTGAHTSLDCSECHQGNYNNPLPTDCQGCHLDDYNATTNPNHSAQGYPTACEDCHTTDAWTPSTFDHDGMYFPIYSGKHKNEWNTCSECHFDANDYSKFSCIDCHEHDNQAEVDDDHDGVGGYMYESNACYSCHPDGEE